ncbi:hypothetical protein ACFXG4_06990 [Nocardia sp. NPDC059246]
MHGQHSAGTAGHRAETDPAPEQTGDDHVGSFRADSGAKDGVRKLEP